MLDWLIQNWGTLLVLTIIATVVAFILIRQAKKPKGAGCAGCSGCSSAKGCSSPEQLRKMIEEYDRKQAEAAKNQQE